MCFRSTAASIIMPGDGDCSTSEISAGIQYTACDHIPEHTISPILFTLTTSNLTFLLCCFQQPYNKKMTQFTESYIKFTCRQAHTTPIFLNNLDFFSHTCTVVYLLTPPSIYCPNIKLTLLTHSYLVSSQLSDFQVLFSCKLKYGKCLTDFTLPFTYCLNKYTTLFSVHYIYKSCSFPAPYLCSYLTYCTQFSHSRFTFLNILITHV